MKKFTEVINKANLSEEYFEIKQWFNENDWKINKVFLGEWTEKDKRWVKYKKERQIKRARLDALKKVLKI